MVDLGFSRFLESEMSHESFKQSLLKLLKQHRLTEPDEIQQALVEVLKQRNSNSVFLISYDLENNDPCIKEKLIENYEFSDSWHGKDLPESTLLWKGENTDTAGDALKNFRRKVNKIIQDERLDTKLSRVAVIECFKHCGKTVNYY